MPVVSKAQNRFMHAHASDSGPLGRVAREYVKATHGTKVRNLPERKKPKKRKRIFGSLAP
jgi:hypothetical protein